MRAMRRGRSKSEIVEELDPLITVITGMCDRFAAMSDADVKFAAMKTSMLIAVGLPFTWYATLILLVSMGEPKTTLIRPVNN